jgi:Zn-dependent protease
MLRSWKLGSAFGIGIFIHWTFPLLLLFVLVTTWQQEPHRTLFMLALVLALFGCVILHELGHALMARRFGIRTRDITLYPIGGIARLERMSERPWEEFWIALAGPAVNVVIVAVLLTLLALGNVAVSLSRPGELLGLSADPLQQPVGVQFLLLLAVANGLLVVFNLIPAFPMDGGRVLRALLSAVMGQLPATEIATILGSVLAALGVLGGFGLVRLGWLTPDGHGNPMLVLLSLFVFLFGQQELAMVRYREAARRAPPVDVIPAHQFLDVSAMPNEPNFSGFTWDRRAGVWIEWRNGRPVHACWVDTE